MVPKRSKRFPVSSLTLLSVAASSLLWSPVALAARDETRRLFQPADVHALFEVSDLAISPEGDWVAYSVETADVDELDRSLSEARLVMLVESVARALDAEVVWEPVLLGALLKAHGRPDVPMDAMPEAKRRMVDADIRRRAAWHGVPLTFPEGHPVRSVDALRCLLAVSEGRRGELLHVLFRAAWQQGQVVLIAELAGAMQWAGFPRFDAGQWTFEEWRGQP